MYIYHERQLGGLCGVHCLNNLLQGPHFGPGDLAEIGVQLDNQEQQLLQHDASGSAIRPTGATENRGDTANGTNGREAYNVDSSADGGNFSIQVLTLALSRFKLELLPAKHPRARDLMKDPPKAASAFLCQYKDHWFAVREVGSCWWNLNSTRERPGLVSPFYLSAWLAQLSAEGYSIYLVLGAPLPDPAKPESRPGMEDNYHEIFDLLERAKSANDRPLGNGEESTAEPLAVSIPALVSRAPPIVQGYVARSAAAQQPFSQWDSQAVGQLWPSGLGMDSHPFLSYGNSSAGFASQQGSGTGTPQSPGSAEALRAMGFRDAQIRAAQQLARGNSMDASDLLLQVHGVSAGVENDGAQLAKAISETISRLERADGVAEDLLQLVTLLSLDESCLRRAAGHTDPAILTEMLLAVVGKHCEIWPPNVVQAAAVAVELLVSAPSSGTSNRTQSSSRVPMPVRVGSP
mmetsp:Transcript_11/g.31  ORF Transcript_11/g.31 Transcript_11/m.31 type:complete len:462 (+) Transcript_11:44-1429(+)